MRENGKKEERECGKCVDVGRLENMGERENFLSDLYRGEPSYFW